MRRIVVSFTNGQLSWNRHLDNFDNGVYAPMDNALDDFWSDQDLILFRQLIDEYGTIRTVEICSV